MYILYVYMYILFLLLILLLWRACLRSGWVWVGGYDQHNSDGVWGQFGAYHLSTCWQQSTCWIHLSSQLVRA